MPRHASLGQVASSFGRPGTEAPSVARTAPAGAYLQMAEVLVNERASAASDVASHPFGSLADSGSNFVEMERTVVEEALAPFSTPPSSSAAAPGHYLSACLGVLGLVEQFQYVGVATLTAPLNAIMPPLPVATLLMPTLGLPHTHTHPPSFITPAPPIPLPSLGIMSLPGSISVLVGGVPAVRCGDVGLTLTCGTFGVPCEVMLGSANTLLGGSRAARMGPDLLFHDNPGEMGAGMIMAVVGAAAAGLTAIGQAAEGNFGGAAISMAQQAADGTALALKMMRKVDPGMPPDVGAIVLGDMTVLVGGIPRPAAIDFATIAGALHGLARSAIARRRAASGEAASSPRTCGGDDC